MPEIMILGISTSPRHGNTESLVKEALKGAEEVEGTTTKFISLSGKTILPCKGCTGTCHPGVDFRARMKEETFVNRPWHLCPQKDVMHEIWDALVEADGVILGTPVYWGEVSAQLKALIDRCSPLAQFLEDGTIRNLLKYKVGGAIAVAGCRNGGQERALETIIHFYMFSDMIPLGLPEIEDQAWGVAGCGVNPNEVVKDSWTNWFGQETSSMRSARALGKKVASLSSHVKGKLI